jgi:hypothetical protein
MHSAILTFKIGVLSLKSASFFRKDLFDQAVHWVWPRTQKVSIFSRGRNAGYPAPPAQIRT